MDYLGPFSTVSWIVCVTGTILGVVGAGMTKTAKSDSSKRRFFMLNAIGVGLLLVGFAGGLGLGKLDFSREYGPLVRRYLLLVSFDSGHTGIPEPYRFTGKIILCNENGTMYSDLRTLPDRLQSSHSADVKQIIFIRKEEFVEGRYTDGVPAIGVTLRVCVVDVASGKTVANTHFTGHAPLSKTAFGDSKGLEYANEHLFDWIVDGKI